MNRIPSLDGLRGVAILMVLVAHAAHTVPVLGQGLFRFAGNGALGVQLFFALSGFLIYNLSAREIDKTGKFDWKQFYMRRILRIFPCFYAYIGALLFLTTSGMITLSSPLILSAATFTLNYNHLWNPPGIGEDYVVIGHYWTLALEEQFYLTWPLLILLLLKRRLTTVLLAIMALAPFIRLACYYLTPDSRGQLSMMFHTGFDSIAAGVLLGELLRKTASKRWLVGLASNPVVVIGTLVFLLFLSPLLSGHFKGAYAMTVGKTLELSGLCLIITAAVSFPNSLLSRFLNWSPLAYIGVLSYSLYVWNNLFLVGEGNWFNVFPLNFIGVAVMALISHYLIERPFLRLKDRFHKPARPQLAHGVAHPA